MRRHPAIVPVVCLVALWTLASASAWARAHGVASPAAVLQSLAADLLHGGLWLDVVATLGRALAGTTLALCVGGAVGFCLGLRTGAQRSLMPVLELLRSVPPILVYPLLLLALGYGEAARLAAACFGAAGVVALPVAQALRATPQARRDAVALAGLGPWSRLRVLHMPQCADAVVTAARLAWTQCLVVTVVTEMLVTPPRGLGAVALGALQEYRADRLWAVIVLVACLSAAVSALAGRAGRLRYTDRIERSGADLTSDKPEGPPRPLWLKVWTATRSSPSASSPSSACAYPTSASAARCSTPRTTIPSASPPAPSSSTC